MSELHEFPPGVCPFTFDVYRASSDGAWVVHIDTGDAEEAGEMSCNAEGPTPLRVYVNDGEPIYENPPLQLDDDEDETWLPVDTPAPGQGRPAGLELFGSPELARAVISSAVAEHLARPTPRAPSSWWSAIRAATLRVLGS